MDAAWLGLPRLIFILFWIQVSFEAWFGRFECQVGGWVLGGLSGSLLKRFRYGHTYDMLLSQAKMKCVARFDMCQWFMALGLREAFLFVCWI